MQAGLFEAVARTPEGIFTMLMQKQVALVTGAGLGNGAAIAKGFAKYGANVVVTDINLESARETANEITESGGNAWPYPLDVTDAEACACLAAEIQTAVGDVTTIVNNAGFIDRQKIDSPDLRKAWDNSLKVNLDGPLNVILAFLPVLRKTKGSIINISSIGAVVSTKVSVSYSVSKAGVIMLTKDLAQELAMDGVRVNHIAPGAMKTRMTEASRSDPERYEMFKKAIPMGRFGDPEELVGPAVFLACPELSSYVTGVMLNVDGGYLTT